MRTGIIFCIIVSLFFPARSIAAGLELSSFDLPGTGASRMIVNPVDGSILTFFHQTHTVASINGSDGSTIFNVPIDLSPTAAAFSPDGKVFFLIGEPSNDQTIDIGIIQAFDSSSGKKMCEFQVEGACNAVYAAENGILYVASGMQYAYQGKVYEIEWQLSKDGGSLTMELLKDADCGKIPWAIIKNSDRLYVTDLELQWTAQADGTMGPPYGGLVWVYDADTLENISKEWVGINPDRMVNIGGGVLVGCSGSKQTLDGDIEPAFSFIKPENETVPLPIGTTGATDLAVIPDGSFAVAVLADWGPAPPDTAMGMIHMLNPEKYPEPRKWIYTGDICVVSATDDEIKTRRVTVSEDNYFRSIAISPDGETIYLLDGEADRVWVLPFSEIEQPEEMPEPVE